MRTASGWKDKKGYVRFLNLQYAARAPVEAWLKASAPPNLIPPSQIALIDADMAALDAPQPVAAPYFILAHGHCPLGAAWVLAGSALGNKSILAELGRAGHRDWPTAFLSDKSMLAFWKRLRQRLEVPESRRATKAAVQSANAVFEHFLIVAQSAQVPEHA